MTPWTVKIFTDDTVEQKMRAIAHAVALGLVEPANHQRIARITRGCPARNDECEINAVWRWWHDARHFRYMADPTGFDTYRAAHRTVELGMGDCDDGTTGLITDLKLAGFATAAKVIAQAKPRDYDHIYAMVGFPKIGPKQWIPLDVTAPQGFPGWEPPRRLAERVFVF